MSTENQECCYKTSPKNTFKTYLFIPKYMQMIIPFFLIRMTFFRTRNDNFGGARLLKEGCSLFSVILNTLAMRTPDSVHNRKK